MTVQRDPPSPAIWANSKARLRMQTNKRPQPIFWDRRISATLWSDFPNKYRSPVSYALSNTNAKVLYISW